MLAELPVKSVLRSYGGLPQSKPSTEGYIKEVMLSFPKGLRLTVREITPSDLVTIVKRLMSVRQYA